MNIIQLSENIEYPQGYNSITIEGYDDSAGFRLREWPRITLTAEPKSITSDGVMKSVITAEIFDPDSTAYYALTRQEHQTAENPTTINTSYFIKSIVGIWYYLGEVGGEPILGDPIEYASFVDNQITTRYELIYQDVWVEYVGNETVSFSVSGDPGGDMSPEEVMLDGRSVSSEYTPDQGEGGLATITARYKNVEATIIIDVTPGMLDVFSIKVDCDPSSINTGETSTVTVTLTDKNEMPVINVRVRVAVIQGEGFCWPDTIITNEINAVEDVISSTNITVNVSGGITRVNSVTAVGYTYTGCTFRGSTIVLNTPLPYDTTPVQVDYDTGGIATTTFYGTEIGISYISAFYKGQNGVTDIEVGLGEPMQRRIQLEADPSSVGIDECSCLKVVVTDADDNPKTGDVDMYILVGGGRLWKDKVSLGLKYRAEWQDASTTTEVTVDYPINDIIDIEFNGVSYLSGATFEGRQITLATPLPGNVPVLVKYNAAGYAENVFYAPSGIGVSIINARYTDETGTYIDTVKIDITVPSGGDGGGDRRIEPIYDTRVVARAIGYVNPFDHIEFMEGFNCATAIDSWGAGNYCDAWGGVDNDPSTDPIRVAVTPAAFGLMVIEYSVSGGTLLTKPNTFYSTLPIAVDWSYSLNTRTMRLRVTERPTEVNADGIPIGDASWILAGNERRTDAKGLAEFPKLPAGSYPTSITHPNYKTNTEDSDTDNDTVEVEETTNKKYKLSTTYIDITVTAKFIAGWNVINPDTGEVIVEPPEGSETPCCEG